MNRANRQLSMNLPSPGHPSPALRAPSPLLRGGERDGVRGASFIDSCAQCAASGPWQRPMKFIADSKLALHIGSAFPVAALCFCFAPGELVTSLFSGQWTN